VISMTGRSLFALVGLAGPDAAVEPAADGSTSGTTSAAPLTPATRASAPTQARDHAGLAALLLATIVIYLIDLGASGWANAFYSAAVQAGSTSWSAFFFGSLDAANSITVDKPPASLWVMALSVRLFGLHSWAILVPQVLMGVATVGVLYATVRRAAGTRAGLIAGSVLALTPVAALMFRFNNPDALLTLLMTLAAWATLRAVETVRFAAAVRWMVLAGVFLGFGFLTKTLQVLLVVPALGLVWLIAARSTLGRRLLGGLAGIGAMVVAGGWWVAIVELMPASARPYIGGSQNNSFLELTFGYNGLGRLNGEETGSVGGGPRNVGGRWGETGLFRMFDSANGGQISWLIPTALILLVVGLWLRGRAGRTDLRRAGYLVWGGWLLITMATFSVMAGIFHEYYTVALAPSVGALIGLGGADAWERRSGWLGRIGLALAAIAAGVWGYTLLARTTEYPEVLRYTVLTLGLFSGFALLSVHWLGRALASTVVATALVAGSAGPAAYTLTTISESHSGSIVTAGPRTGTGFGAGPGGRMGPPPPGAPNGGTGTQRGRTGGLLDAAAPGSEVVAALTENADAYTWVAATVGSQNAAGLQLGTQLPVMAIGGFNGSDPSPTLEQFQQYVAEGRIHWFVPGGMGGGLRQNGGARSGSEISAWVEEHFTATTVGSTTMYDLSRGASA